jgi:phage terminase small subunit
MAGTEPHDDDLMGLERAYRSAMSELSDQQRIFVRAYIADPNGAEAARSAGCATKSSRTQAAKWLAKGNISRAVKLGLKIREHRLNVSADLVVSNLLAVRDQSMAAAPVFDAAGQVIEGVWQYDSKGAIKAVELLGKAVGMFGTAKEGGISLEAHSNLVSQMGIELIAAITECIPDEALRTTLITAVDKRWQAISAEPNRPGSRRAP